MMSPLSRSNHRFRGIGALPNNSQETQAQFIGAGLVLFRGRVALAPMFRLTDVFPPCAERLLLARPNTAGVRGDPLTH